MYLKVYEVENEVMVAACDCQLVGKTFAEGDLRLSVDPVFFGQETATPEDVGTALMKATIANLVGEKTITCALEMDFVDAENILHIDRVPYAQMVRM